LLIYDHISLQKQNRETAASATFLFTSRTFTR
jgi:hypothetical protein